MKREKLIELLKEHVDLCNYQANEACFYLDNGFYPDGRDVENPRINRRLQTVNKILEKEGLNPREAWMDYPEVVEYAEGEVS